MKSILITLLLAISLQIGAQNMFFKPFTFMEPGIGQYVPSWGVFEDEGGYSATGISQVKFFVLKTDYYGDSLWFKMFSAGITFLPSWNHGSWYVRNDGYKIFTIWDSIFLFDSEWNKTSLAPLEGVPHPRNVAVLSDGNYVFSNYIASNVYTLVKVNSETLEVIWTSDQLTQIFSPRWGTAFYIRELVVLPDGGILAVAWDYNYDGSGPYWYGSTLFKIDPEGRLESTFISPDIYYLNTFFKDGLYTSLTFEHINYYEDNLYYVTTHTADGQEIAKFAIPQSRYGCYILKDGEKVLVLEKERSKREMVLEAYTTEGINLWSSVYTLTSQYWNIDPGKVIPTTDGGYLIYGDIYPSGNQNSLPFILKTNQTGQSAPLSVKVNDNPHPYQIYPNPATSHIRITGNEFTGNPFYAAGNTITDISVYDTRGILRLSAPKSVLPINLNITTLPPGVYILKFSKEEKVKVMKFVKK